MLALETEPRNAAILRLTYCAGLRVSEVAAVFWHDLVARDGAGQITVFGKGGKTRPVLLPAGVWAGLVALRCVASPGHPLFLSAKGGHLDRTLLQRIVKAAAKRAGLSGEGHAHWLLHAHVSHVLDRGVPAHLVQATIGHATLSTTSRYAHARLNDSSAGYPAV